MLWRPTYHKKIAQLADLLTTAASFVAAYFLWEKFRILTNIAFPIQIRWDLFWIILGLSIMWVIIFSKQSAYSYQRFTSLKKEVKIVTKTTLLGILAFFVLHFLFRFGYIPRTYIVIFAGVNFLALCLEKLLLFHFAKIIRKKGVNRKKILVVGTGKRAELFIETVEKNLGWGLDIIGLVSGDKANVGMDFYGHKVLGNNEEIEKILHQNQVDEVIICVSTERFAQIRELLACCEREGVQVRLNSDFFGNLAKKVRLDNIYGLSIISFITTPDNEFSLFVKRIMDVFVSGILLLLLSPLLLVITILIKMTSKGPVLYQWNVVGLNKKSFKSWKFRTMVPNADDLKDKLMEKNEMQGPVFKIKNDPRITPVGRILRKFSLDELPQLWSVLKGDMSLVGPRPAGPHELARYESWQRRKLSIKPGITCLWQVSGRNRIRDFDEWIKLDLQYIENWSLWLDIKILLKTIPAIFAGTGV